MNACLKEENYRHYTDPNNPFKYCFKAVHLSLYFDVKLFAFLILHYKDIFRNIRDIIVDKLT